MLGEIPDCWSRKARASSRSSHEGEKSVPPRRASKDVCSFLACSTAANACARCSAVKGCITVCSCVSILLSNAGAGSRRPTERSRPYRPVVSQSWRRQPEDFRGRGLSSVRSVHTSSTAHRRIPGHGRSQGRVGGLAKAGAGNSDSRQQDVGRSGMTRQVEPEGIAA